jgi:hypothetical protein
MHRPLHQLITLLSGSFSNQNQAFENPPLYAHIHVAFRPLVHLAPGSLMLEQWYAFAPGEPYRIRVLRATEDSRGLVIHNHALHEERRFWGAVNDPSLMATIREDDLRFLDGCSYVVRQEGDGFVGEVEPGCRCLVERKGSTAYLVSHFEISPQHMRTIDRGHDPTTHEHLWGSLAGPFEFERHADFAAEIPADWAAALA